MGLRWKWCHTRDATRWSRVLRLRALSGGAFPLMSSSPPSTVVDKQSQPIFKSRIYWEGVNNLAILLQILSRILEIRRKTHLRSFSHERIRLAKILTKIFETFDHHWRPNMCQLSPARDFCLESVVAHTPSCLYELKWSGQTCEGPTKGHPYYPNWDDY